MEFRGARAPAEFAERVNSFLGRDSKRKLRIAIPDTIRSWCQRLVDTFEVYVWLCVRTRIFYPRVRVRKLDGKAPWDGNLIAARDEHDTTRDSAWKISHRRVRNVSNGISKG